MKVVTMNISLPADLAGFVRERVRSGLYASASEVVREALRILQRSGGAGGPEEDEFDRAKVALALESLRKLAQTQVLGDELTLKSLIEEGRP